MDAAAGSLEELLELAARDEAAGLGDAPWPPHFRKMEGEAPRVAPSRAGEERTAQGSAGEDAADVVANSPDKRRRWRAWNDGRAGIREAAELSRC